MIHEKPTAVTTTTGANLLNFLTNVFNFITTNSGYVNLGSGTQDVILDFGANITVGEIKLWMYYDGREFRNVAVYGSTDNSNWVTLRSPANWVAVADGLTITVSPAASYRYIKFYSEGNVQWNSNEYNEIMVSDGATDRAYGQTCDASGEYSAPYLKTYANDNDLASRWASNATANPWWSVDLGAAYAIDRAFIIWERASAVDYDIQYSDDNSTWTDAVNVTGAAGARGDRVFWTQANAHRYWRIYTNTGNVYGLVSAFEIRLYGDEGEAPAAAGILFATFI